MGFGAISFRFRVQGSGFRVRGLGGGEFSSLGLSWATRSPSPAVRACLQRIVIVHVQLLRIHVRRVVRTSPLGFKV